MKGAATLLILWLLTAASAEDADYGDNLNLTLIITTKNSRK
jgi:hypothetical protein